MLDELDAFDVEDMSDQDLAKAIQVYMQTYTYMHT